jgi:diguanylate cyclase (GGDEF)-like protein/PAS domain S-box-containing protein
MDRRSAEIEAAREGWPDAAARLEALVDSLDDAVMGSTLDGIITDWSRGAERMFGGRTEEVLGRRWAERFPQRRAPAMTKALEVVRAGGPPQRLTVTRYDDDDRRVDIAFTVSPIRDTAGTVVGISTVARDITPLLTALGRERRAAEDMETQQQVLQRIAQGDDLSDTLVELCRDIETRFPGARCSVLTVDSDARVLRHAAAPSLPDEFREALVGLPIAVGMGGCGTAAAKGETVIVADTLIDPITGPFVEMIKTHGLRSMWSYPLVDRVGEILGTFAVYRPEPHEPDRHEQRAVASAGRLAALAIERRRDEEALTLASLIDPLTGLPNRAQFLDWLERALADDPTSVAVLFLDLDRFKSVNDSMGHPAGDQLLVEAAQRLASVLRSDDVLSRFGGDEFTILVREPTRRGLASVTDRVQGAFSEPFPVEGREFYISASIGVAVGRPGVGPFDLIRDADVAMYEAKGQGPGRCVVFGEQLRHRALERVTVEAELRQALERDELVVVFQPVFDLQASRCVGAEALVRWQHPERGLLGPGDFVPIAEESGLIVPLGDRVLELVVAQQRRWLDEGVKVAVSVNVSPVQLADPHLVGAVADALARHEIPSKLLYLEITETAVMEQIDTARSVLTALAHSGIGVYIDDFGTGYSSIARLSDLPVSGLKIDRRFTSALGRDPAMTKVTVAIIDLAHALDLQVIAEGIETVEALDALVALECSHGQGFHLGRPGPPEVIVKMRRRSAIR